MAADKPFYEIDPLPEEVVLRLRLAIGALLVDLPEQPDGVWYRFRFDVCTMAAGVSVVHVRHYPIEAPELDIHEVAPECLTSPLIPTKR